MADITRQRLNVDDRGFAGPMLPDLAGPAMGGAAAGIPRDFMRMLAEAHAMRQRQAAMQLQLMGEDIRNQRLSRDMAREVPGQSRNQQAMEAAAVRQAAGQAKQAKEGGRQARIGTQAQLGRLGAAMSHMSPNTWGKMDRASAYGALSGLSGNSNLAGPDPRDLLRQQPSGVGQAFDERQYARGMDASPYSFLGTAGRNERADPRFTASQAPRARNVRSNEKGTLPGTVPKTGTYKLHKDEIVISAPQVAPGGELDSQLMNALIEDKMRKGITGKNPKGSRANGYQTGSLVGPGPYVPPTWSPYEDIPGGFTLPNRPETRLRLGAGRLSGFEDLPLGPELEPPGPGVRPEWSPDVEVQRKIRGLLGPGEGGMTRTGPGVGPTGRAGGSSATSARAGRKLLGPGSSVDEIVEAVAKESGQAKGSLKGLPKGVLLGMAAGLGIYAAAKALGGDDAAGPPAPAGPDFWSDPSAHSFGAMLRGVPGAAYGNIQENLGKLGEVWGGLTGGVPPPAQAQAVPTLSPEEDFGSQSTSPSRGDLMAGSAAGPEIPENLDLAVALERARGRDFGTPKDPLTLSGSSGLGPNSAGITAPPGGRGDEDLPESERYFAPESAEWRKAQSQQIMATANREKADRIRDYLLSEGENMDADTRKDLMRGAEWLDNTADMVEQRFETAKEKRLDRIDAMNESLVKYQAEAHKAAAADDEKARGRADNELEQLKRHYNDLEKMYVNPKNADGKEEILATLARTMMEVGRAQRQPMDFQQAKVMVLVGMGKTDEARGILEETGASPEEIEEFLATSGGG